MKICSTTPVPSGFPQTVTVSYDVTPEQIANLMISFMESGDPVTRGWVKSLTAHAEHKKVCTDPVWYADPKFYQQPGFILRVMTLEDMVREKPIEHLIGACAFHAGLTKLAGDPDYRRHFMDLISDNSDASTADIVMQFVVFGKEVFA